jgi:flagellar P-ring protein precursor FlgI
MTISTSSMLRPLQPVTALVAVLAMSPGAMQAAGDSRLKDVITLQGVASMPVVGYGLVVGLNKSGDKRQTIFSTQALDNMLARFGLNVPAEDMKVKHRSRPRDGGALALSAAHGLTSWRHPSAAPRPQGGTLLPTSLAGGGQMAALAQGPLTLGGFGGGSGGTTVQVNHLTVGRIPGGAIVQALGTAPAAAADKLTFAVREPDFITASRVAAVINDHLGTIAARVLDPGSVVVEVPKVRTAVPN